MVVAEAIDLLRDMPDPEASLAFFAWLLERQSQLAVTSQESASCYTVGLMKKNL